MFITKLFVIIVVVEAFIQTQTQAHISVQIDPEDMDQIADFFESFIWTQQEQQRQ